MVGTGVETVPKQHFSTSSDCQQENLSNKFYEIALVLIDIMEAKKLALDIFHSKERNAEIVGNMCINLALQMYVKHSLSDANSRVTGAVWNTFFKPLGYRSPFSRF